MTKTVYTDRFGVYPWALLGMAALFFWRSYQTLIGIEHDPFGLSDPAAAVLCLALGIYFLYRGVRRLKDVRSAKREGRDHTVLWTKG